MFAKRYTVPDCGRALLAEELPAIVRFADSPFTWGGLGVVLGCALGSPAAYKYAFWFGFIVVAIAIIRAKPFKECSTIVQVSTASLFCVGLGVVWLLLWNIIPRPGGPSPNPPTKEEIADAVVQKLGIRAKPEPSTNPKVTVVPKSPRSSKTSPAEQIADAIVAKIPQTPELSIDLLIPAVHKISSQLQQWDSNRKGQEQDLQNRRWMAETHLRNSGALDKLGEVDEEWVKKIQDSQEILQNKLQVVMADADSLRQLMMQKLPQSKLNEEDRRMSKDFKDSSPDVAADYLEHLVKRI
jgi:hypothetical protein